MNIRDWLKRRKDTKVGSQGEALPGFYAAGEDDEEAIDPFNPFPEPVRLEIRDILDLHTIAPRDVKRAVEEYLAEARRAGFSSVRIIHGKGKGVQREMVRSILARTPFVQEFTDAPPQAGGLGATIAHLSAP
jgi:dsDNA-specific endonuclease/ATPase MutS2